MFLVKELINNFVLKDEDWSKVSEDAKRLIRKMLVQDPAKRLSSAEAYNDPWIQKNTNSIPLNTKCLSNMSNFQVFL